MLLVRQCCNDHRQKLNMIDADQQWQKPLDIISHHCIYIYIHIYMVI